MPVQDNTTLYYRPNFERPESKVRNELFPVEVLSVDYERKALTVQDFQSGIIYHEITTFPAAISSIEGIDVNMPEQGAIGLAGNLSYNNGFRITMVVAWLHSQTYKSVDSVASRPISGDRIQGWTNRRRGSFRKAFPGQRTSSYTEGFSERISSAWDRQSADYSRDKIDSDRRQRTQITGRNVDYSDAGVGYHGSINRPTAKNIHPVLLPDGTMQYIAYLQPGSQPSDRYISGKQDVIPFSEDTELVQEYALDYPVPFEVLQTTLLDKILGTTADPWARTVVTPVNGTTLAVDSETFTINQGWDHPDNTLVNPVGPTTNEGATPQRRGYIIEKTQGTLVGYNLYDPNTYGYVLKPQLFVSTAVLGLGKFGSSVESGYNQVVDSTDHIEARLAASCLAIRFPYEQNTTRLNVTKEGLVQMELGATLPKENVMLQPAGGYEYPYGAGRSLEAHLVGSAKLVIGKNRDEEEALDAQILGQTVLRLGADDTSLPNARRTVQTQTRSKNDLLQDRAMQYWTSSGVALKPGDAGNLNNWGALSGNSYGASKVGAESVSLRAAFDGGTVIRLGAKNPSAQRRHLINGYIDGQGKNAFGVGDSSRVDSKSYRQNYAVGDSTYQFHDLTKVGEPLQGDFLGVTVPFPIPPYDWSGSPITSTTQASSPMDSHGQSLDLHAVRDVLFRIGANTDSGQSIEIDTAGGIVLGLGTDKQGRSITAALDGGIEITIKPNKQNKAIRLNIVGDIDVTHFGHVNWISTGDIITQATTRREITMTDKIETQQKVISASLAIGTTEAPEIINNQGLYTSTENAS